MSNAVLNYQTSSKLSQGDVIRSSATSDNKTRAHQHMPPSDSVSTAAAVSGQEVAGGTPADRPRRSCISQLEEDQIVSARELWRSAESRREWWLDDPLTVHKNDHILKVKVKVMHIFTEYLLNGDR